jgi:ATP-dependent DNA ligase
LRAKGLGDRRATFPACARAASGHAAAPCLPTKIDKLPSGSEWLHEIKHDGFRIIARKKGAQVRLYSRPGNDLTRRFPLIVETLARLRSPPASSTAKRSPAMKTSPLTKNFSLLAFCKSPR